MEKIKGVNLGSWFVLEKWMVPHLFEDINLENEGLLTLCPESIGFKDRLKHHYETFITQCDFVTIKEMGLNIMRIPVPHTMFESESMVLEYLDKAFDWAEACEIKILIDLHTVPGGQNGFDNSCYFHKITWDQDKKNITQCIEVIDKIIWRYGKRKALYGIEPINEPLSDSLFQVFQTQYSVQSKVINLDTLKTYYQACFEKIKEACPNVKFVIHDGFDLLGWNDFMVGVGYENVVIDTHLYLNFELMNQKDKCLEDYLSIVENNYREQLMEAMKYHHVIVGEWSLGNKITENITKDSINQILYDKQIELYEKTQGWIFWSYKNFAKNKSEWSYELLFHSIIKGEK